MGFSKLSQAFVSELLLQGHPKLWTSLLLETAPHTVYNEIAQLIRRERRPEETPSKYYSLLARSHSNTPAQMTEAFHDFYPEDDNRTWLERLLITVRVPEWDLFFRFALTQGRALDSLSTPELVRLLDHAVTYYNMEPVFFLLQETRLAQQPSEVDYQKILFIYSSHRSDVAIIWKLFELSGRRVRMGHVCSNLLGQRQEAAALEVWSKLTLAEQLEFCHDQLLYEAALKSCFGFLLEVMPVMTATGKTHWISNFVTYYPYSMFLVDLVGKYAERHGCLPPETAMILGKLTASRNISPGQVIILVGYIRKYHYQIPDYQDLFGGILQQGGFNIACLKPLWELMQEQGGQLEPHTEARVRELMVFASGSV